MKKCIELVSMGIGFFLLWGTIGSSELFLIGMKETIMKSVIALILMIWPYFVSRFDPNDDIFLK